VYGKIQAVGAIRYGFAYGGSSKKQAVPGAWCRRPACKIRGINKVIQLPVLLKAAPAVFYLHTRQMFLCFVLKERY
jgi:hypothetical protein